MKPFLRTVVLVGLSCAASAQTVTGSLRGTVTDPAGSVVVGANVNLANELTKQIREFPTDANPSSSRNG